MVKLAEFERCDIGYSYRLGAPDEFSSALGLITIAFNTLEKKVSLAIHELLQVENEVGNVITGGLSFQKKIALLSSLYQEKKDKLDLKMFDDKKIEEESISEVIKLLSMSNQLRNKLIHSVYLSRSNKKAKREKVSVRAGSGLKVIHEDIEVPYILDVYDFLVSTFMYVEDYFVISSN